MADSDEAPSLITCSDCGKPVPEGNMTLHQLRACKARARRPGDDDENDDVAGHNNNDDVEPMDLDEPAGNQARGVASATDIASVDSDDDSEVKIVEGPTGASFKSCPASPARATRPRTEALEPETPQQGLRRRRRRVDTDDAPQSPEVVDLVADTPSPGQTDSAGLGADQWACPQCTLHNLKSASYCAACHNPNPERPPDPVLRERLIGDDAADMSPLTLVSGGAIVGGLLGAAGSFLHGRDPFSAAAEGAMTGVMGGAFLNELMSSRRGNPRRQRVSVGAGPLEGSYLEEYLNNAEANHQSQQQGRMSVAQARSSASITGGYPSINESSEANQGGNSRARPRSSFRVVREQNLDGTTTTMVMGGNSTTRVRRPTGRAPQGMNDPMLTLLLHSYLEQQYRGGMGLAGNVDGMSYEQLLHTFGDGTDNLGANDAQIASLPTQTVQNPEKELPEDARQCLICLEDIAAGESRMILPCLHGFHATCCDKWMRTNASCPICKHRLHR